MKIELMIYVYIAICVSMMAYNIVYVFILRRRDKALIHNSAMFETVIAAEIRKLKNGEPISDKHKEFLRKKLDKTGGITAFDKALELIYENEHEWTNKYLIETFSVFEYLTYRYIQKDTLKIAYFPYILYKYEILQHYESERLVGTLLDLVRSVNVYCRENALKAIYCMQRPDVVIKALQILDTNLSFHHSKLVCDGLLEYTGDKAALKDLLFDAFYEFSVQMQVNILNYFRLIQSIKDNSKFS